jgi:hypothetical protein
MSKILYSIIDDLLIREDKGLKEYGTTMDRTDLRKIIKTKQNENAKRF